MYKCPHCGMQGISVWRKLNIGILNPTICKQCGNKVGIPGYAGAFIAICTIALVSVAFLVDSIMLKIIVWVVLILIMGGIFLKYVPLVPKYK